MIEVRIRNDSADYIRKFNVNESFEEYNKLDKLVALYGVVDVFLDDDEEPFITLFSATQQLMKLTVAVAGKQKQKRKQK